MLIGVIADDFTGASDIANTLAKGVPPEGGLRTVQYPAIPTDDAASDTEAGVISLKSRSAPVAEALADSLAALEWLLAQGCKQIIFKYCSTFDSTPEGNIGPVAKALADRMEVTGVVVCPAFPTAGRTIYQGHLFVFDTLLSESGMQHHPLTPMTDPDIRRWLGLQTSAGVGHVPLDDVTRGADAISAKLTEISANDQTFAVADAVSDADLLTLGEALSNAPLITGGSGIALGLPRNLICSGQAAGGGASAQVISGPEALLAGSCSGATRGQIEEHAKSHPVLPIDVPGVMAGTVTADDITTFIYGNQGEAPLAYSSGTPEEVAAIQDRFGPEAVSARLDKLFADVAARLVTNGYRRLVVAGGETSGAVALAVTRALNAPAMHVTREIDPGVPVLALGYEQPVALALKSGNFGARDFFSKALKVMMGTA